MPTTVKTTQSLYGATVVHEEDKRLLRGSEKRLLKSMQFPHSLLPNPYCTVLYLYAISSPNKMMMALTSYDVSVDAFPGFKCSSFHCRYVQCSAQYMHMHIQKSRAKFFERLQYRTACSIGKTKNEKKFAIAYVTRTPSISPFFNHGGVCFVMSSWHRTKNTRAFPFCLTRSLALSPIQHQESFLT